MISTRPEPCLGRCRLAQRHRQGPPGRSRWLRQGLRRRWCRTLPTSASIRRRPSRRSQTVQWAYPPVWAGTRQTSARIPLLPKLRRPLPGSQGKAIVGCHLGGGEIGSGEYIHGCSSLAGAKGHLLGHLLRVTGAAPIDNCNVHENQTPLQARIQNFSIWRSWISLY